MKFREVAVHTDTTFRVPQGIQRIDHLSTHGWQLRYGGTKFFGDTSADDDGARASLAAAQAELVARIAKLPAPTSLQAAPSANKTSDLPPGISGPVVYRRKGAKVLTSTFSVLVPRFGQPATRRSVYIASENTYSVERYRMALVKALTIRSEAEEAYRIAATRAKREQGRALKVQ